MPRMQCASVRRSVYSIVRTLYANTPCLRRGSAVCVVQLAPNQRNVFFGVAAGTPCTRHLHTAGACSVEAHLSMQSLIEMITRTL